MVWSVIQVKHISVGQNTGEVVNITVGVLWILRDELKQNSEFIILCVLINMYGQNKNATRKKLSWWNRF